MPDRTFQQFCQQVQALLDGKAKAKKYNETELDGPNRLYEFVQDMTGGHHHALGEIVYKCRRYAALGNEEDVLKIAAWAFLIYKHRS